jgi:photosystem II stability/assembly factor-like uncharacterized protein
LLLKLRHQMKKIISLSIVLLTLTTAFTQNKSAFTTVKVDTILHEKIGIRAITIDGDVVWYVADKGRFGFYNTKTHQKFQSSIKHGQTDIEFRSIAKTSHFIYALNVGNPALLYQISKDGMQTKLAYEETHEKVFYDSMQFWNDQDGIAMGDPIEDCLSMLITHDGGNSWQKLPCSQLPKVVDGEAAFAASNTNIVVKGNQAWIVSGGKKARIFYSPDQAKTWQSYETPIVQGLAMTGIFTADFYNDKIGFIAGGNYDLPERNSGNKAITKDGGKTWELLSENQGFGYASCVQFVPKSNAKQLVSVGASGLQYSSDTGNNWKKLLEQKDLYTIRFLNKNTAIAAGRNGLFVLHFK